jgi:hypothetical protein
MGVGSIAHGRSLACHARGPNLNPTHCKKKPNQNKGYEKERDLGVAWGRGFAKEKTITQGWLALALQN